MPPESSHPLALGAPPRRVLIIEDNPDSRDTLRELLDLQGHQVEAAEDGCRGLEKALAWRPDVAIVDIGLPLLSGYEVARQLRAAFGESIVLIALTGYAQPGDRQLARDAGFNVHMSKPADLDELGRLLAGLR